MKFLDSYNSFFITLKDDLTVESRYVGGEEKPEIKSGTLDLATVDEVVALVEPEKEPEGFVPPTEEQIADGGDILFGALFVGKIETSFGSAYKESKTKNVGLKIFLNCTPRFSGYPWELARFDDKFLATEIRTPFIRVFPGKATGVNLGEGKLPRVLSVLSNVEAESGVDVVKELANLTEVVDKGENFGGYKNLVPEGEEGNPSLSDIEKTLNDTRANPKEDAFNILHFLAHGKFDDKTDVSALVMQPTHKEKNEGSPTIDATGKKLAAALGSELSLSLIVLNACSSGRILSNKSGLVPELLQVAPAVVAMRRDIGKHVAKEFTKHFYSNFTLENAEVTIQFARKMLLDDHRDTVDFTIPLMYLGYDESTGAPANRILEKTQQTIKQWDLAVNLNPAASSVISFIDLHDKSILAKNNWGEYCSNDDNWNVLVRFKQEMIKKLIFGEFNSSLSKISSEINDTFPLAAQAWCKKCGLLDTDMTKFVEVVKGTKRLEIRNVVTDFQQDYAELEKLFARIITANKEVT
jgi:hypothetical protein